MKFAYIIPFSNSDKYRLQNITTLIDYYKDLDVDIFIAEQLTSDSDTIEIEGTTTIPIVNDDVFSKSYGNNFIFKKLKDNYDIFIFGDADVVIDKGHITNIINEYKNHKIPKTSVVTPYIRNILFLDEPTSIIFRKNRKFNLKGKNLNFYEPFGGIFFMPRETYIKMKGFDETFAGWGAEDSAMRFSAKWLNIDIVKFNHLAYHMWHPRAKQVKYEGQRQINGAYYKTNYHSKENFDKIFKKRKSI